MQSLNWNPAFNQCLSVGCRLLFIRIVTTLAACRHVGVVFPGGVDHCLRIDKQWAAGGVAF